MSDKFGFEELLKVIPKVKKEGMILLANQAQNYFVSSFKKQGFDGKDWQEVQRRIEGTNAYKYPKKIEGLQRRTSPILVGAGFNKRGGTLSKAVTAMSRTAEISESGLRMIVDVPYAEFHNDGGKHLPQRRFIGQTDELTRMQTKKVFEIIDNLFKQ